MNVGDEIMDRARELIERRPGLSSTEAMHRVLRDDPALLAAWHKGEAGSAAKPAADTVDPAVELQEHMRATGCDFAAALIDRPDLATAWHRGEPVARSASRAADATIDRFRAAMGGTVSGNTITGVEVFAVGQWNGRRYSSKALDDMVTAFEQVGYRATSTLGHNAADDAFAHGYISLLYRKGDVLLAYLAGVPAETIQAISDGRGLSVSAEVYIDLRRVGKTFPHAIHALSLLGAHPPEVKLKPIAEALPAAA